MRRLNRALNPIDHKINICIKGMILTVLLGILTIFLGIEKKPHKLEVW